MPGGAGTSCPFHSAQNYTINCGAVEVYRVEVNMRITGVLLAWALASCAGALKNPLLPGYDPNEMHQIPDSATLTRPPRWNPDPHVLRVDDTYYIAVSSFLTYPGLPIYQSKDLANWELVSHALDTPEIMPLHGTATDKGLLCLACTYT